MRHHQQQQLESVFRLFDALVEFEREGFAAFADEWQRADALRGAAVTVHTADGERPGIARGIDTDGALRVETARGIERFVSGEVTLRAART